MTEIMYGKKYERGLDVAEIAKRLREEMKAAIKAGEFPRGTKTKISIKRFAGGRAINFKLVDLPGVELVELTGETGSPSEYRLTADAKRYVARAESMLQAYNFDGSDSSVDYWHVNFYGYADLDSHTESRARRALMARNGDVEAHVSLGLERLEIEAALWKWSPAMMEEVSVWLDAVEEGIETAEPAVITAAKAEMAKRADRKAAEKARRAERKALLAARSAA